MGKRRARRVPPLEPGERKQYAPGTFLANLDPATYKHVYQLAAEGTREHGRGALMVELDDTTKTGVSNAQFFTAKELRRMNALLPSSHQGSPAAEALETYNPAREFLVMFLDVSPHLPGPQMYWELMPIAATTPDYHKQRLLDANRILEEHIRELTNGQPRGFVLVIHYRDVDPEPLIQFHRLSDEVGKGFVDTAPDLVELVHSYDPRKAFILFEAEMNVEAQMLDDVEISEQQYLFPAPMGWAPLLVE